MGKSNCSARGSKAGKSVEQIERLIGRSLRQPAGGSASTELAVHFGRRERIARVAMRRHDAGLAHRAILQETRTLLTAPILSAVSAAMRSTLENR